MKLSLPLILFLAALALAAPSGATVSSTSAVKPVTTTPIAAPPVPPKFTATFSGSLADTGFITDFLACGPWRDLAPDRPLLAPDEMPFEAHVTRGRLWTPVQARDDGFVDLGVLFPAAPAAALAHVYLFSPRAQDLALLLGVQNHAALFLNGRPIFQSRRTRSWQPDQEKVVVHLDQGWNRLLLRADNELRAFGFSLRLALPDGRPVRLRTSAAPPDELLADPQFTRPLSPQEADELAAVLDQRIRAVSDLASPALGKWFEPDPPLDHYYGEVRTKAAAYLLALQDVLAALRSAPDEPEAVTLRPPVLDAAKELRAAALAGPVHLADRTDAFLAHAELGARPAALVPNQPLLATNRPVIFTALEAGRQAAEVDRALGAARVLLAALRSEYLRPARLRDRTLRHRTAEMVIHLAQRDGTPLDDALVEVDQLDHEFLFGCNLFAFQSFPTRRENAAYLARFHDLFNLAVVPTYWSLTEPHQGRPDYLRDPGGLPGPEAMINWCADQHIKVLAGPLLSSAAQPPWLRSRPPAEALQLAEAHVRDLVQRFKGRVAFWNVTDGAWPVVLCGQARLPVAAISPWVLAEDPAAATLLAGAGANAPANAADPNRRDPSGPAGLTLAAYQSAGPWPTEDLDARLARLDALQLPLHVSQVMIPGPARDEERQADAVEAFYRAAFSNSNVRSISWWDLSDRFALAGAPGGLLRAELTPKPAYDRLVRLIHAQWSTNTFGRSDPAGAFAFRGFFGRYRLRVTVFDGLANRTGLWELDLRADAPHEIRLLWPPEP